MKTRIFTGKDDLAPAADILRRGGFCAVPTETVYGLCVNGLDPDAVAALYELKGRPEIKPLSLMVAGAEDMDKYTVDAPAQAGVLAGAFWPGPLTIVLEARDTVPSVVRAGGRTVGLRCPGHPMALSLLRKAGLPLAGPSANPSGSPSPKTAEAVLAYFDGKIDALLDGGPCGFGRESTIIDLTRTPYRILRRGALDEEAIDDVLVGAMEVIGLTGGTGSGKTTVLHALEADGVLGLDCDELYHRLLEEGGPMMDELRSRFSGAFSGGSFDRKALGRIVFSDAEALRDLNAITHRYVREEVLRLLRAHARNGGTRAAIDAVELIESGLGDLCSFTVGVVADPEKRAERVMARESVDRSYVLARIAAQKGDEYYEKHCTYVIRNDGTREELLARWRDLLGSRSGPSISDSIKGRNIYE